MVCGTYLAAAIVVAVPFVIQVVCGVMCGVRDIPCSCYRCSSTICHSSCVQMRYNDHLPVLLCDTKTKTFLVINLLPIFNTFAVF